MSMSKEDFETIEALNTAYENELKKVLDAEVGLKMAKARIESFTITYLTKHLKTEESRDDLVTAFRAIQNKSSVGTA